MKLRLIPSGLSGKVTPMENTETPTTTLFLHPFDIPLAAILGPSNSIFGSSLRVMQRTVVRNSRNEPTAIRFTCNNTRNIDAAWQTIEVPAYNFPMRVVLDHLVRH